MRKTYTEEELAFATVINLRQSGKTAQSSLVKEVTQTTPTRTTKIMKTWKNQNKLKLKRYTANKALGLNK